MDGAHERTTLSGVMRYLVPGFAVTTSIESAPMRDVREISVEIGAVAARSCEYRRASRSRLYGATFSVHFADSVCGAR